MRTLSFIIQILLSLIRSDHTILVENIMLRKENHILKRKLNLQRIRITKREKLFFVFLHMIGDISSSISIVSPATLLHWQRMLIKHFWTFFSPHSNPGRPPVPNDVKQCILQMKNSNILWGAKRIRDELRKLGIFLHKKTIQNIIHDFRKRGKIRKSYTWKKFLSAHIDSLFAMDYFTVDTIFAKEFIKQQLIAFEDRYKDKVIHLIHDNDPTFVHINYVGYSIKNIKTSIKAPDINAIAERFVRSIRSEALDNFVLLNHKQISKIITEYIECCNSMRPHQGVNAIPQGKPPDSIKPDYSVHNIKAKPVLGGLHHHYYREAS